MITAVLNIKGGCGKTTTAEVLARGYAKKGFRTLVVDTDGQCSITNAFLPKDKNRKNIVDLLKSADTDKDTFNVEDCIHKTKVENLDIMPASLLLFSCLYELQGKIGSDFYLMNTLTSLDYDQIVVDCNPSITKATYNAIYAADRIIIPVIPDEDNVEGLGITLGLINDAYKMMPFNKQIDVKVLICQNCRDNTSKKQIQDVRNELGELVMNTEIRFQAKPVRSSKGQRIDLLADQNMGVAKDYKNFLDELIG